MKKLITLYETKEDDMSRSAIALCLKSISKAKIEHVKDNEVILAPMVFLAMHGPKDDGECQLVTILFLSLYHSLPSARDFICVYIKLG